MAETIQDIYDEMTDEERDLSDLIIGAAVNDEELPDDMGVAEAYDALSDEQKNFIHFVVGNAPSGDSMAHSEDELMHFGVKGMRWGVRNDTSGGGTRLRDNVTKAQRDAARAKVKAGKGTLGDAHIAGLKSTGHRVTNALLGDKTYWKRQAIIGTGLLAGVTAAIAVPALLPAGALAAVGTAAYGTGGLGLGTAGHAALGSAFLTNIIGTTTGTIAGVASNVTQTTNLLRAIRGNARIEKSYEALGKSLHDAQTKGSEKVQKTLNRSGSIGKKVLHMEEDENSLAHFGIKGMRWGIRRSDRELAKVHMKGDDDTESTASVHATTREAAKKIKNMPAGSALVVDAEDGTTPKVLIKQADGSFKETKLSVDAERLVKTNQKSPSEMSDREIKEAIQRADNIEKYNKIFNPVPNPNQELQDKVNALQLQKTYKQLQAEMNPKRESRVKSLVNTLEGSYNLFNKVDKTFNRQLSKKMNSTLSEMMKAADEAKKMNKQAKAPKIKIPKAPKEPKVKAPSSKANTRRTDFPKSSDEVYNITNVGNDTADYGNPFIPAIGSAERR